MHQDLTIVGIVGNMTLGNLRLPDLPVVCRPPLQAGRLANFPSLVASGALFAIAGFASGIAPARRAVRIDPVIALRAD